MTLPQIAIFSALLLAFPATVLAQNSLDMSTTSAQSPITINSCGPILTNPAPTSSPNPIAQLLTPSTSAGMRIQFTNESGKVADLVNFEVRSNATQFIIRHVGTFSPAISNDHQFRNRAGQPFVLPAFIAPPVTCRVASVRLTDRSVWPAPAQPAAPAAPGDGATLSANPASVVVAHDADSALVMISSTGRVAGFNENDTCNGIAAVYVSTTAQNSAVYSIKPIAPGTCALRVTDEAGRTISVPVAVQ